MSDKEDRPTIVLPPFKLTDEEVDDLFKALEPDPGSARPGECGKPHPTVGKDLVCDKPKEHMDKHERYAKGEFWDWDNAGLHSK